ncbi:MAG: heme-binding protein [Rhodospirillaceae bacterium]|jgi:uncharacterized protein GlcG (DUF336 family)|nr:heme-binding protein [Rhodospirillaceae bacterium]
MITLEQAENIINAIFKRGRELNLRPLSVVVVEPGAKVKLFKKEDGSSELRFEMAMGKAYASLAMGRSSSLVRVRAEQRPMFMDFLMRASDGQIFPEGGGMLIRGADGALMGAVGVTGDTQEMDEELAAQGIRAAGLLTDDDAAALGVEVRIEN